MENLTRIGFTLEDLSWEIEGTEAFVKEEWGKIKDYLLEYLQAKLRSTTPTLVAINTRKLYEFYQQKNPRSHLKTITVFAYYLKHFEGKEEFSQTDLRQCYQALGLTPPKVLTQAIRDVRSRYKYFNKGSKRGYYTISPLGEKFVEEELPK
ncbi:MAG TPA: hypothetical protein ENG63_01920 [Candidatus Desulfofervidus auxilii]|uniref:Uncharacterized protein n=1 Tax=Desulfofervidus auxilii TaxID=1621989 RepID=A0A7C0Y1R1_DESA2|nr:hypothetical protein [Candidatus Desulfofervidus auxilii]HDD43607.1 hypothetical protein [Candidatus Desulfofervidus auxilii]